MDIVLALVLLIVFLIVLVQSSRMVITNSVKVSDITGLSKTTVGFILLAFSGGIRGCNPFACAASLGASDTPGSFICFQQGRSRHRQK
jgi:hypothetical protein